MKNAENLRIVFVDNFAESNSPARIWRDADTLEINLNRWNSLPAKYRDYILAHEEGHYVLDTSDEMAADRYAFNKIAGTRPGSLRDTANTVLDVLPGTTDEQLSRMRAAVLRSLAFDAVHNDNRKARDEYARMTGRQPEAEMFEGKEPTQTGNRGFITMAIAIVLMILILKR